MTPTLYVYLLEYTIGNVKKNLNINLREAMWSICVKILKKEVYYETQK